MVSKEYRLHESEDIKKVLRQGRLTKTPLILIYKKSSTLPHSRFACVVSKAVSPSSVIRHRLQRWLREVGKKLIEQKTAPADIVIVGRPALREATSLKEVVQTIPLL